MTVWSGWLVVLALAVGTFLIRYSFMGWFAKREMPPWLQHGLTLMVPAIFSAIVAMALFMHTGQWGGLQQWPRYGAAVVALAVALRWRGHLLGTVIAGMLSLHALLAFQRFLG